jgi:RNA polymerase subunit RPABC4/transcription elongation factor Spt4
MSTMPAKTCKTCFMEIDSRAKKCPYCHTWQTILSINNPLIAVFLGPVKQ